MGTPAAMPDSETVAWPLDCADPSVRYLTLTLLGESADGVAAAKTRCRIMTEGAVPLILAAQHEEGHTCERERFYTAKYTGTVWQLIILTELGADGGDECLHRACEVILCDSQDAESGGISVNCARAVGGHHGSVMPRLTGNLIFSLIKLDYLDDPRVRRAIDFGSPPTSASTTPTRPLTGRTARGTCAGPPHLPHRGDQGSQELTKKTARAPFVGGPADPGRRRRVPAQAPFPPTQPRPRARVQTGLVAVRSRALDGQVPS